MKYRQLNPAVCEAVQWLKHGDHPSVVIRSDANGSVACELCGQPLFVHGFLRNHGVANGFNVCPGDYIVHTDFYYPLDAKTFDANYAPVVSGDAESDLRQSHGELSQVLENVRARNTPPRSETGHSIYSIRVALHWLQDAIGQLA